MKALVWLGSSLEDVRGFPESSRKAAGFELHLIQSGRTPSDWKPMTTVGAGVNEIRIHGRNDECRVIYVAKFAEAVYVLHAFMKKTRQTSQVDIDLARTRLKQLTALRREAP